MLLQRNLFELGSVWFHVQTVLFSAHLHGGSIAANVMRRTWKTLGRDMMQKHASSIHWNCLYSPKYASASSIMKLRFSGTIGSLADDIVDWITVSEPENILSII